MVQVVQPTASFGQRLGEGFGAGIQLGLQEQLQMHRQKKEQEAQQRKMADSFAKLDKLGNLEDLDFGTMQNEVFKAFPDNPEMAQMLIGNVLKEKLTQQKQQASQLAALRTEKQEERAQRTEARALSAEARQEAKFARELQDDQGDIDFVKEKYGIDVNTGKAARTIISSREKEMFEPTLQKGEAEGVLEFRKNIKSTAEQAKKELPALKAARTANMKNVTGLGDMGTLLFRAFGNEDFLSGDAAVFNNAVKNLLGSARKDLIGGRASQQEFFFIQQLLPSLGKSKNANEALFNFLMTAKEMQLAEANALNAYEKEIGGLRNAGPGYEAEVIERADPIKDAIWEEYRPVLAGKKGLFDQQIEENPELKKKAKAISPDGELVFLDKSKVKEARERGYYVYGR